MLLEAATLFMHDTKNRDKVPAREDRGTQTVDYLLRPASPFNIRVQAGVWADDVTLPGGRGKHGKGTALKVLRYLVLRMETDPADPNFCACWPSQALMAQELGIERTGIWRALKKLAGAGLIRVDRLKLGNIKGGNRYTVLYPRRHELAAAIRASDVAGKEDPPMLRERGFRATSDVAGKGIPDVAGKGISRNMEHKRKPTKNNNAVVVAKAKESLRSYGIHDPEAYRRAEADPDAVLKAIHAAQCAGLPSGPKRAGMVRNYVVRRETVAPDPVPKVSGYKPRRQSPAPAPVPERSEEDVKEIGALLDAVLGADFREEAQERGRRREARRKAALLFGAK